MSYTYGHLTNPTNTQSGIGEMALIAPVSWFAANGIKSPGTGTDPGDEVVILEDHVFLANKGFVKYMLAPEKNSYTAETSGAKMFAKFQNTVNIFIPGSYDEVHEALKHLKDEPLIVLVRDSDCGANLWYQVGNSCVYAWLQASLATGTTAEGEKGYTVTITNHAKSVILYQGAIVYNSPYLTASGSLAFADITTTAIRSTWTAVSGATSYILQRDTDPNFRNPVQVYSGGLLTYLNTGLVSGKKYYYRVIAVGAGYNNGYPKAGNATTIAPPSVLTLNINDDFGSLAIMKLKSTANETVKVKWDTALSEIDVVLTAGVEETINHAYGAPGTYTATISHGPGSTLTELTASGCKIATITGIMPPALISLELGSNNLITSIPALPATITNIDLYGSDMSVTAVSNLLIALDAAGASTGTADLRMAPAAIPNAGGLAAKASLEGRGWTVLVNS